MAKKGNESVMPDTYKYKEFFQDTIELLIVKYISSKEGRTDLKLAMKEAFKESLDESLKPIIARQNRQGKILIGIIVVFSGIIAWLIYKLKSIGVL